MNTLPEVDHPGCQPAEHPQRLFPDLSDHALDRAARLFRALGDTARLKTLALLGQGPACVSELAAHEQENVSTVSQRLKVLRLENLVSRTRQGKHIQYSLADQHVAELVVNALAHASEPFSLSSSRTETTTKPRRSP